MYRVIHHVVCADRYVYIQHLSFLQTNDLGVELFLVFSPLLLLLNCSKLNIHNKMKKDKNL